MSDKPPENTYLSGPLGVLYAKTALPIVFVMWMNGLLSVVDALFLGHFVGAQALAAVTLMFPAYMVIVALATLVSSGMSSILARHLGAGETTQAQAVFAGAHGLAVLIGGILMLLFFAFGPAFALVIAGNDQALADLGVVYLRITVLISPLMFVLSVNSDALRNEGRVGFMAAMSLLVSIANIGFNYVLIGVLNMGVAGSALGTALAQALAFFIILGFRLRGQTRLRPNALWEQKLNTAWPGILALGAPQSLSFIGLAIGSTAILVALQWVGAPNYPATVSAYGIITRVMTFAYLPLLGLSHAMQSITGNNFGAQDLLRVRSSLKIAVMVALVYCCGLQLGFWLSAGWLGGLFVDDLAVIAEVGRILPVITACFFLAGPLMILSMHFQAIGDAARAALLGLSKPYLFAVPLTFAMAATLGEGGIWLASPVAEVMLLGVTALVLMRSAAGSGALFGRLPIRADDQR